MAVGLRTFFYSHHTRKEPGKTCGLCYQQAEPGFQTSSSFLVSRKRRLERPFFGFGGQSIAEQAPCYEDLQRLWRVLAVSRDMTLKRRPLCGLERSPVVPSADSAAQG
uniref:Uncharacterized protein n=1 Tax=Noctiluca scintillans TaxID=2966 RepID=A0A7S1F9D5_NOCSC|mmetsp:Transcript_42139/g.111427  ORF Transcript_42139/g.111427 Transcript_42139/m.111427 type:complete len:108 (+) Transcript_42139:116-439(+)